MTFDEFKTLVKGMKSVYTSDRFLPDPDSIKIWFQMLQDLDYSLASVAVQKYMMTNKFPPTIADIRAIIAELSDEQRGEDWSIGWGRVLKAIGRYGYCRPHDALDSLDEISREVVKCIGWNNLCCSENISIERASFRQIYETIRSRRRESLQLSQSVNQMIGDVKTNAMGRGLNPIISTIGEWKERSCE